MTGALLTQQVAAARIGISVRALQRVLAEPDGPPTMAVGGRRYLHSEDLDAWLDERRAAARRHHGIAPAPERDSV